MDWCAIRYVAYPAFMWGDTFVNCIEICAVWCTYIDISIFEPETRVDIRCDFIIGFYDAFDIGIHKVVEGVYVLFDKTFHFEECGEKQPFVLRGGCSFDSACGIKGLTHLDIFDRICETQPTPVCLV